MHILCLAPKNDARRLAQALAQGEPRAAFPLTPPRPLEPGLMAGPASMCVHDDALRTLTLDLLTTTVPAMNSQQQSVRLEVVLARYKAGRSDDEAMRAAVADVLSLSDMLTKQAGMISQGLDHGKAMSLAREIASQIDGAHAER